MAAMFRDGDAERVVRATTIFSLNHPENWSPRAGTA
jgi:hypothetical protein